MVRRVKGILRQRWHPYRRSDRRDSLERAAAHRVAYSSRSDGLINYGVDVLAMVVLP